MSERGHDIKKMYMDLEAARSQHVVHLDCSNSGGTALRRGEESLLVNAAITNEWSKPMNAPWLLHVDLPKAIQTAQSIGKLASLYMSNALSTHT